MPEIISGLGVHPAAALFPQLEGKPFDELVEDIRKNGVVQPITLWNGQLVDGRNRLLAARKAGIESKDIPVKKLPAKLSEADVYAYVYSLNYARRHLTDQQRAAIVIKIMEATKEFEALKLESEKEAKVNRQAHIAKVQEARKTGKPIAKPPATSKRGKLTKEVAKRANTSEATAAGVLAIKKTDPEKFKDLTNPNREEKRGRGPRVLRRMPNDPVKLAQWLTANWSEDKVQALYDRLGELLAA